MQENAPLQSFSNEVGTKSSGDDLQGIFVRTRRTSDAVTGLKVNFWTSRTRSPTIVRFVYTPWNWREAACLASGVDLVRKVGGGDEEWSGRVRVGGRWQSLYIGGATILRMGYKKCCERSEQKFFLGFYPKLWNFWGTLVANEVKKLWNIFVLKAKGSSCPLLARCLAKSVGTNYTTVPPPEILGDSSPPRHPVIYAPVSGYWLLSPSVYK